MPEPTFLLPGELRIALAQYLAARPYSEVAGFVAALGQLRPADAAPQPPEARKGPKSQLPGQQQPDTAQHYQG